MRKFLFILLAFGLTPALGQSPTITSWELVMDDANQRRMGMGTWDGTLGVVKRSDGIYDWYHSEKSGVEHNKFSGSVDKPGTTRVYKKTFAEAFTMNGHLGSPWIGSIYRRENGHLLAFIHIENGSKPCCQWGDDSRIGIAYSTNDGASWNYCGHVIQSKVSRNMGGCGYLVKDGFVYLYYTEKAPTGRTEQAVARARLTDVLGAAQNGQVTPWFKYLNGGWTGVGLGGDYSPLNIKTGSSHGDAVYLPSLNKCIYVSVDNLKAAPNKLKLFVSNDGVQFDQPIEVEGVIGGAFHYVSIVPANGEDDNGTSGSSFYVYATWEDGINANNDGTHLYRAKVTFPTSAK